MTLIKHSCSGATGREQPFVEGLGITSFISLEQNAYSNIPSLLYSFVEIYIICVYVDYVEHGLNQQQSCVAGSCLGKGNFN